MTRRKITSDSRGSFYWRLTYYVVGVGMGILTGWGIWG